MGSRKPKYWRTENEIDFLKKIGTIRENQREGLTRFEILTNYIAAAEKRDNWGKMNKENVLAFAHKVRRKCLELDI